MNVGTKLKVLGKCESQEKVLSFIVYRELVDVKLFNLYNVQQLLWCEKKLVKKNCFLHLRSFFCFNGGCKAEAAEANQPVIYLFEL